jgi:hypothetical protein
MANELAFADHLRTTRRMRHCINAAANFLPEPNFPVVYFLGGPFGHIKIGHASRLRKRIALLQTGNPSPLQAYAYWPGGDALEREAHRFFERERGNGEWFGRTPRLVRTIQSLQDAIAKPLGITLSRVAAADEWSDLA